MKSVFYKGSVIPVSKNDVFTFHERSEAFKELTPPDFNVEIVNAAKTLKPSEELVRFIIRMFGLKLKFSMVHTLYSKPDVFVDEQFEGIFSAWKHTHLFSQGGTETLPATLLTDKIEYSHPLLPFMNPFIKGTLTPLFKKRHAITNSHFVRSIAKTDKRVIVTGATGFIGRNLIRVLLDRGVEVVAFVRDIKAAKQLFDDSVRCVLWDFAKPESTEWKSELSGVDSIVHLAGTPLFSKRWSKKFKKKIETSRVVGTKMLVDAILETSPKTLKSFVCASAVGYYGVDNRQICNETSEKGGDFLADVCSNWELETAPLEKIGVRRANMRIGVVLGLSEGVLGEFYTPFKLGLGGVFGKSNGWINWIHIEDVVRIFEMAVFDEDVKGVLNVCSPQPALNKDFCMANAAALKRPSLFRYPSILLKMLIGEAGGYASGGARVYPEKTEKIGYKFLFSELETALQNIYSSK